MLKHLPASVKGILNTLLTVLHTLFWCVPLYIVFFLKIILPYPKWQRTCYKIMASLGNNWIRTNNLLMDLTLDIKWDLPTLDHLSLNDWYFIIVNHQSWSDILILQRIFLDKTPFIRFFIKKQLLWLPVINIAWLAFDYPIMHRYPKETLIAHPELRGKDLAATQKSCERYKLIPVSILNFLEGTRFTELKHTKQHSPYHHLLIPKAGGLSFAINAMDKRITHLLDVTIAYPEGRKSFWDFLCGKVHQVVVKVQLREIPPALLNGNYADDEHYRQQFKTWVNAIWNEKDQLLKNILKE
jgi:1-acyl-sn-glycerol-3-phosphate acyltransferase